MQDFRRNCMGEFDFLTPTNLETTMNLDSLEFLYVGLARTFPYFLTTTDFDDILPQNQSESETNEF